MAASRIGVDPTMLARWERGEKEPAGVYLALVNSFPDGEVA